MPIGALQAGEALWHWSVIPLGLAVAILSTALPYSLEMIALTRLPTRTFGTLMSMEPALAAVSGMIFLGETLTPIQAAGARRNYRRFNDFNADSTQREQNKKNQTLIKFTFLHGYA